MKCKKNNLNKSNFLIKTVPFVGGWVGKYLVYILMYNSQMTIALIILTLTVVRPWLLRSKQELQHLFNIQDCYIFSTCTFSIE